MFWATVSSQSCFCWLYRASLSLAAKNIINQISVLIIWWCPCVFLWEGCHIFLNFFFGHYFKSLIPLLFLRYFVLLLILVLVLLFFWISLGGSFLLVSRVLCRWVQVAVVGGPVSRRLCSEEGLLHSVCNWLNVSTIDSTWAPEQVAWLWACSAAVCFTLFLSNYFLEVQLYPKLGFFLRPWQPCQVFLFPLYVDTHSC